MGRRRAENTVSVLDVGYFISAAPRLPALAFLAATALVLVPVVDPSEAFALSAEADFEATYGVRDAQTLLVGDAADSAAIDRGDYTVTEAEVQEAEESVPAVGTPDPGSAKAIAYDMVADRGWSEKQYACLVALWNRESHWNVYAANSNGAYGIPQALPGSKMASAGSDWKTSAKTQITWGLGYITGRYGTPCVAWAHSESTGWY
ncbi:MAG: lytic transglycosylase domain-containing protein [Microbacteriaceae bacterium]